MAFDQTKKILITGAHGFLGWHLRLCLRAAGVTNVITAGREDWGDLGVIVKDVDVVFHLAGINRAEDEVVERENFALARSLRQSFASHAPSVVVFANTIHADMDTPYGRGKDAASRELAEWMAEAGGTYSDVRLPNLFGEHGRPFYNSFVATFVELLVLGGTPDIVDREVPLLQAQRAAQALIEAAQSCGGRFEPQGTTVLVSEVWQLLKTQYEFYSVGTIPDLSTPLHRDLFNALRARMFNERPEIALSKNSDARGAFVETARVVGGQGQTSFSTTVRHVTRGDHFHLRKMERFIVLSGRARISIERVGGSPGERVDLNVTGEEPVAVDMPTGWAHNITNIGDDVLITQFWISEIFDATDSDTFPCVVEDVNWPMGQGLAPQQER